MAPLVLILGAGPNIGQTAARRFAAAGYRVATVSRSAVPSAPTSGSSSGAPISIRADLADPDTAVPHIFSALRAALGGGDATKTTAAEATPDVVIFNAAAMPPCPDPKNLFSIGLGGLRSAEAVMVDTPFAVAGEVVKEWLAAGGGKKTFIYTGNQMAKMVIPMTDRMALGLGKTAASFWVQVADATLKENGIRFFFADERGADGGFPMPQGVNGESHSDIFLEMAEGKSREQLPTYVTFVGGKHVEFP